MINGRNIKKTIVSIDDSNVVLMSIEKILSEKYQVKSFSKVMRGMHFLKLNVPDLIILDIDMPEMDGMEALKHIKEREELKDVPVIFLTSNADREHVVNAVALGAVDYMIKPVKEEILLSKIRKIFGEEEDGFSWDKV